MIMWQLWEKIILCLMGGAEKTAIVFENNGKLRIYITSSSVPFDLDSIISANELDKEDAKTGKMAVNNGN